MTDKSKLSDRERWDLRYATPKPEKRSIPTPFLMACLPRLPSSGLALDAAAGAGRNSVALAAHGLQVHAVDVSFHGLQKAQQLAARQGVQLAPAVMDLKRGWLPRQRYDVVVNSYFLLRDLIPVIKDSLKPGGWLVFETFTVAQLEITPHQFKDHPDHLLQPGELRRLFAGLSMVEYWEGTENSKATARLLARNLPG